jgi:hypothetical protein
MEGKPEPLTKFSPGVSVVILVVGPPEGFIVIVLPFNSPEVVLLKVLNL